MKLEKISFHAYKSLVNLEIELNKSCIGIVGINESGKSNILKAINTLDTNFPLTESDTPKMVNTDPHITFIFLLSIDEKNYIEDKLKTWCDKHTIDFKPKFNSNLYVEYNVKFDIENEEELRYINLKGVEATENVYFLKQEYQDDDYQIFHNDEYIPLKNALVIPKKILQAEIQNIELNSQLDDINEKIFDLYESIEDLETENESNSAEINQVKSQIESLEKNKKKLEERITFNVSAKIEDIESDIEIINEKKEEKENLITSKEKELKALTELDILDATQETKKTEIEKNITKLKKEIGTFENEIEDLENQKESAQYSIVDKYTQDISEFDNLIRNFLEDDILGEIPKVVFWENDDEYILKSATKIETLLKAQNESTISRPLMNLFRISFDVKTLDDFKSILQKISKEGDYRSSAQKKMNKEVNKYIKNVWKDYSQELNISLEEHQIRVEIFDPEREENANFYKMEERSQGFKTFISFILTIGAEAQKGVIKDTILLLDEPENHLHPSGVRFMLEELKNISKNNLVIYATHSNHMIDKNDYSSHLISKKIKDRTDITQAVKDRIGYFMQEEVLFDGLEIDLSENVASVHNFNFVFEGDGDASIFKYYYEKILKADDRPFQLIKCRFFQGGKCSDIKKYFANRPIQLGTKWVFILDNDQPAKDLKKFIEGKYKDYVDKDIFTFLYDCNLTANCELEDLLPKSIIIDSINASIKANEINDLTSDDIKTHVNAKKVAYEDYMKEIKQQVSEKDRESFIAKFKEELNKNVKVAYEATNDAVSFKKAFPNFSSFLETIMSKLASDKSKLSNKKEAVKKTTS